jgi:hypothetical protein
MKFSYGIASKLQHSPGYQRPKVDSTLIATHRKESVRIAIYFSWLQLSENYLSVTDIPLRSLGEANVRMLMKTIL